MFSWGTRLLRFVFRLFGIPDPWFSVDGFLVKLMAIVCLVAIPAIWLADRFDVGGKVGMTVMLVVFYAVCVIVRRKEIAGQAVRSEDSRRESPAGPRH